MRMTRWWRLPRRTTSTSTGCTPKHRERALSARPLEHRATLEKLRGLKGAEFDKEFVRVMIKDHQMAVDRLTSARTQVTDPEYVSLIDKLLPTIKQHVAMAQKLQDNLSKS